MTDIVKEAGERYRETLQATRDQRQQIEEDLRFTDPSNPDQWDEEEKRQRQSDPGGKRPCLVFDQTGQYISNVAGQVEQRPPSLHAIPVGSGADKKVAESLDGLFRHIEHTSRAQQHYARALTSAARVGVGYLVVRPEYTDRALGYQEPRISSEGDPLRVVLDPFSVELDGSDADFGQLITPLSLREFERRWGNQPKISFGDEAQRSISEQREQILVAEEWRKVEQTVNMVFCVDLAQAQQAQMMGLEPDVFALPEDEFWDKHRSGQVQAMPDAAGRQNYSDKRRLVKWVQMSGAGVLTEETEYPASGIGIVPVYGYVGWANGRMNYCGIGRRARSAQQAYNFHRSEIHVLMGDAAKAPYLMPMSALGGQEKLKAMWDRASVERRAFLPYEDWDEVNSRPIQAPQRMQPGLNLQNHLTEAEQALRDIQSSIGMYQANLGAPSNETSGVAIDSRKEQGEASTAHFPQHLGAALGQVGKLIVEMIPRLIDTRRQLRILSLDGTPSTVTVDPKQPQAQQTTPQGLSVNPCVGKYDVRVVIGSSFSTQRAQSQTMLTEMLRAYPNAAPALLPFLAQTVDIPGVGDKMVQVLTAIAPPEVRSILQPDAHEDPAALKSQLQQMQQQLQEAVQLAHEAQAEADEAHAQLQDNQEKHEQALLDIAVKKFDAVTRRIAAVNTVVTPDQVAAIAQETVAAALAQPTPDGQAAPEAMPQAPAEPVAQPAAEPMQEAPQEMEEPMPDPIHARLDEIMHGHQILAEALGHVLKAVKAPRKRTPVRDHNGDIVEVRDELADTEPK